MAPGWKGKDADAKALEEAMSKIISQLQSSLVQTDTIGFLCDNSVLIEVEAEKIDLLGRACFGQFMKADDKDKGAVRLGLEEAFYLCLCVTVSLVTLTFGLYTSLFPSRFCREIADSLEKLYTKFGT